MNIKKSSIQTMMACLVLVLSLNFVLSYDSGWQNLRTQNNYYVCGDAYPACSLSSMGVDWYHPNLGNSARYEMICGELGANSVFDRDRRDCLLWGGAAVGRYVDIPSDGNYYLIVRSVYGISDGTDEFMNAGLGKSSSWYVNSRPITDLGSGDKTCVLRGSFSLTSGLNKLFLEGTQGSVNPYSYRITSCIPDEGFVYCDNLQPAVSNCPSNQSGNNSSNQSSPVINIIQNNISIFVNPTIINIYNNSNVVYLNISQNYYNYTINYSVNGLNNLTINQNFNISIFNVYNISVYLVNNSFIIYNITIIYNNQTSNNSSNNSLIMPDVNITSLHNGTIAICSNNSDLNVLASWDNNISPIEYSFDGVSYFTFYQNMSLGFVFGINNLILRAQGLNGVDYDVVNFNLVNNCSQNNSSNVSNQTNSIATNSKNGCKKSSDYNDWESITFDNSVKDSNTKAGFVNSNLQEDDTNGSFLEFKGLSLLNILLFLGVLVLVLLIILLII
jgi:hypothetical protein